MAHCTMYTHGNREHTATESNSADRYRTIWRKNVRNARFVTRLLHDLGHTVRSLMYIHCTLTISKSVTRTKTSWTSEINGDDEIQTIYVYFRERVNDLCLFTALCSISCGIVSSVHWHKSISDTCTCTLYVHTRKCMTTTWNTEPFSWAKFCFCLRKYQYEWNANNEINRIEWFLCVYGWAGWVNEWMMVLWHIQICKYIRICVEFKIKTSKVLLCDTKFRLSFALLCIARSHVIFLLIWLLWMWVLHRALNLIFFSSIHSSFRDFVFEGFPKTLEIVTNF